MIEIVGVIEDCSDIIEKLTCMIYQENTSNALECMDSFLNNIVVISEFAVESNLYDNSKLLSILKEAMSAMELKDYVLLADILKYDMKDELDDIRKKLE